MPTPIRSRLIAQIVADVSGIAGIGSTITRWDARQTTTFGHLDCVVSQVGDEPLFEFVGNPGTVRRTLSVLVSVVIRPSENDSTTTDALVSTWAGNLEHALLANRTRVETATSKRLAVDSVIAQIDPPEWLDGASAATVRVDITYDHDGDSVYANGTLVPAA